MSTAKQYRARCDCGSEVPVERSAAGGTVVCRCGRNVDVPRLSELKRQAGEVVTFSACDRVRQLLLNGGLPPDPMCRITQRPTADVVHLTVVCEQPRVSGGHTWWWLVFAGIGAFCVSWWMLPLYLLTAHRRTVIVGPETVFRLPVPVASDRQSQVRDFKEAALRELLCTVPLYAELLSEFPRARVSLG